MECSKLVSCAILLLVLIATALHPTQAAVKFTCPGKQSWPELVGEPACKAATIIERQNKLVRTIVMPLNSPVIGAFRCDRVRVLIDHTGNVVRIPVVG